MEGGDPPSAGSRGARHRVAHDVRFVPFCGEVGGAWGSKAKTFFQTCVALAGDDRDIDLYHWSSERFSAAWKTTISVLVAKGRARVGWRPRLLTGPNVSGTCSSWITRAMRLPPSVAVVWR